MTAQQPAYPHLAQSPGSYQTVQHSGLTKRELFASMAMQGLLAGEYRSATQEQATIVAFHAVEQADALLAALDTK